MNERHAPLVIVLPPLRQLFQLEVRVAHDQLELVPALQVVCVPLLQGLLVAAQREQLPREAVHVL